jgi:hypothetical protein
MENNSRKMISALLVLIMACLVTAGLCQLPVHASTSRDYIPYDKHDLLWSWGFGFNDFGEVVGVTKSSSTGVDVAVRLYDPEGYAILLRDFPRALKSPWTYSEAS